MYKSLLVFCEEFVLVSRILNRFTLILNFLMDKKAHISTVRKYVDINRNLHTIKNVYEKTVPWEGGRNRCY